MAFVYCGLCMWSQDDFWSRRYNPVQSILHHLRWNWSPHWVRMDTYAAVSLGVRYREILEGQCIVHSWRLLWFWIRENIRRARRQHWWSYRSWVESSQRCPRCGGDTCLD